MPWLLPREKEAEAMPPYAGACAAVDVLLLGRSRDAALAGGVDEAVGSACVVAVVVARDGGGGGGPHRRRK